LLLALDIMLLVWLPSNFCRTDEINKILAVWLNTTQQQWCHFTTHLVTEMLVKAITLPNCVYEVLGSSSGRDTNYPNQVCSGSPKFLGALIKIRLRPQLIIH
jgi:hypothetical protein